MRHSSVSRVGLIRLLGTTMLSASLVVMAANVGAAPPTKGGTSGTSTQNWDTVLPPDQRFTVLADFNNEAVRDNETGLVWERSPDLAFRTWSDALRHCANREVGGRFGFRLPSMPELATLVDTNTAGPIHLPAGHPFLNVQPSAYRSSTTDA